jgi:hypothetical protein
MSRAGSIYGRSLTIAGQYLESFQRQAIYGRTFGVALPITATFTGLRNAVRGVTMVSVGASFTANRARLVARSIVTSILINISFVGERLERHKRTVIYGTLVTRLVTYGTLAATRIFGTIRTTETIAGTIAPTSIYGTIDETTIDGDYGD